MGEKNRSGIYNKSGYTLVMLVITIAIVIVMGTSLLTVSMINYKMKRNNTAIKKAVYLAEVGLHSTYTKVYELVEYAISDSLSKVQDYLELHSFNEQEAEELFYNSYKLNIIGNINSILINNSNLKIKIIDPAKLIFIDDSLSLKLQSNYKDSNVEQLVNADIVIKIPNYSDAVLNSVDILELISMKNWVFTGN